LKLPLLGTLALGFSALAGSPAQADFILHFNETGTGNFVESASNGAIVNGYSGLSGAVIAWSMPDQTGGITKANVLEFFLPELVFCGDVGILAADGSAFSHVLTFTNGAGALTGGNADRMIFYSADIAGGLLADSGLPDRVVTAFATQDSNGNFAFIPASGFGYFGSGDSGSLPTTQEPASTALTGLGMAVLALGMRRRPERSAIRR
jgi:hypothetical protein